MEVINTETLVSSLFAVGFDKVDSILFTHTLGKLSIDTDENGELKYALRSVFKYLPWIRKVFVVMPNEKLRFINSSYPLFPYKFSYIKNTEILPFESSTVFTYNMYFWKLKKFGMTENFLIMDDDYFIAKPLKKSDFFYVNDSNVIPYIYGNLDNEKDFRTVPNLESKLGQSNSHNSYTWNMIYKRGYLFLQSLFNHSLTTIRESHNIGPLSSTLFKELYNVIVERFPYKNYALKGLFRNKFQLEKESFYYMYNKYKVKFANRKYSKFSTYKDLDSCLEFIDDSKRHALFPLNTGGNYNYFDYDFAFLRICMAYLNPEPTIYENLPEKGYDLLSEIKEALLLMKEYAESKRDRAGGAFTVNTVLKEVDAFLDKLEKEENIDVKILLGKIYQTLRKLGRLRTKSKNENIFEGGSGEKMGNEMEFVSVLVVLGKVKGRLDKVVEFVGRQSFNNVELVFVGDEEEIGGARKVIGSGGNFKFKVKYVVEGDVEKGGGSYNGDEGESSDDNDTSRYRGDSDVNNNNVNNNVRSNDRDNKTNENITDKTTQINVQNWIKILNNTIGKYVIIINEETFLTKSAIKAGYKDIVKNNADVLEYFILRGNHYNANNYDNNIYTQAIMKQPEIKGWFYYQTDKIRTYDNEFNNKIIRKQVLVESLLYIKEHGLDYINEYLLMYVLVRKTNTYILSENIGAVKKNTEKDVFDFNRENIDFILMLSKLGDEDIKLSSEIIYNQVKELTWKYKFSMGKSNKMHFQALIESLMIDGKIDGKFKVGILNYLKKNYKNC